MTDFAPIISAVNKATPSTLRDLEEQIAVKRTELASLQQIHKLISAVLAEKGEDPAETTLTKRRKQLARYLVGKGWVRVSEMAEDNGMKNCGYLYKLIKHLWFERRDNGQIRISKQGMQEVGGEDLVAKSTEGTKNTEKEEGE